MWADSLLPFGWGTCTMYMHRLACVVSLLTAPLAVGCGGSSNGGSDDTGDDGSDAGNGSADTRGDKHDVTIAWHIRNLDGTVKSACPAGFDKLIFRLYKDGYVEPPDSIVRMPCTTEGTLTRSLPTSGQLESPTEPGSYYDYTTRKDVSIDVTEDTEEAFAARSEIYRTQLTADLSMDFDLYPDGGKGVAAWVLQSSLTDTALGSCAAASVDTIEYATKTYNTNDPLVVGGSWPCANKDPYFFYSPGGNFEIPDPDEHQLGVGHTKCYPPGEYYVELRAKRAGATVGTSVSSMIIDDHNNAIRIVDDVLTITDR
ncbi:hypothetical protein BH11MYX2_BH11MYX2_23920 [soil metagenome]